MTLFIIVSLSKGLILLKLITSQSIPYFSNYFAAYSENFTFLENATIVACCPYLIILAFPIGSTKSSLATSSGTSKASP